MAWYWRPYLDSTRLKSNSWARYFMMPLRARVLGEFGAVQSGEGGEDQDGPGACENNAGFHGVLPCKRVYLISSLSLSKSTSWANCLTTASASSTPRASTFRSTLFSTMALSSARPCFSDFMMAL